MNSHSYISVVIFVILLVSKLASTTYRHYVPVVKLIDSSGGHTLIGQTLILECKTTFYLKYISLEWQLPKNLDSSLGRREHHEDMNSSDYKTIGKLIIDKAELRHSGSYKCKVSYKKWIGYTFYSNKVEVPVYRPGEHSLEFFRHKNYFEDANPEVEVYIRAHPYVSVIWLDKNNKTITGENSSKFITSIEAFHHDGKFNYHSKLLFKNITSEDFGQYTVIAKNKFQSKYKSVLIDLTDYLKLGLMTVHTSKNEQVFICQAIGYPKPVVTVQLNGFPVSMDQEELFSTAQNNTLQTIFRTSLNPMASGKLVCTADNGNDIIYKEKYSFSDREHGLHLLGDDFTEDNRGTYVLYASYRTTVDINYVISRYSIAAERWTGKNKTIESDRYYERYDYDYSDEYYTSVDLFTYNLEEQMGNYTCELLSKSGDIRLVNFKVVPKKIPTLIPKISVEDVNKGHTLLGQDIKLKCQVIYYQQLPIQWNFGKVGKDFVVENKTVFNSTTYTTTSEISIKTSNESETSLYTCLVKEILQVQLSRSIYVPLYGYNDMVISFDTYRGAFDVKNMKVTILILVHPPPVVKWYNNKGEQILSDNSSSFFVNVKSLSENYGDKYNYETTLRFKKAIEFTDFGNYTASVTNGFKEKNYTVSVNVTGVPSVYLDVEKFDEGNMTSVIKCVAVGYPEVTIKWYFKQCLDLVPCILWKSTKWKSYEYVEKNESYHESKGVQYISHISVNTSEPGVLDCVGMNSLGKKSSETSVFYVNDGFDISSDYPMVIQNSTKIMEGVKKIKARVTCIASIFKCKNGIQWYKGGTDGLIDEEFNDVFPENTLFGTMSSIDINHLDVGNYYYICNGLTKDGILKSRTLLVKIRDNPFLFVNNNNLGACPTKEHVEKKIECKLYCYSNGFPTPVVKWYKNDQLINSSEKIQFLEDDQVLIIKHVQEEDLGVYKCEASNGFETQTVSQPISSSAAETIYWLVPVLLLVLLTAIVGVLYILKLRRENKLIQELKLAGLAYFDKGNLECLNPELRIEDQTEMLPYDKKWEIPKENIKLGKQLGSGAFGIVLKAELINFYADESNKTVAVKSVSKHSGFESVKALASELKIMAYIGKHVNIVNLIGACTENITKKQLYVVVEYCHFGNLQNFVQKYSKNFVDQKNAETDTFDWDIGPENQGQYPTIVFRQDNVAYVNSQETGDSAKYPTFISSKDFLVWAFQIARGMEYLGSRRIVHGDLAARNVLLTRDNVIKVSDFGLSKKMYQDGDYVRKGEGPLPVKWMAIEALGKGIFSIQSDIWAFGIVLWEIFSLGETPYPGVAFDKAFYKELIDGYRMEQPKTATTIVYDIMYRCWNSDPLQRPSFADLVETIGSLLEEPVRNHYIDMNGGYVLMNQQASAFREEDYLTIVKPPTFENVVLNCSTRKVTDHSYDNSGMSQLV